MFLFSCSQENKNCSTDNFFIDDGKHNVNVEDNNIYIGGLSFYFDLKFKSETSGNELFLLFDKMNYSNYSLESEFDTRKKHLNTIKLSVFNNKCGMSIGDEQTIMKYEYLENTCFFTYLSARTGLIENGKMIYLHPPRTNGLEVFEIAPFPYIEKPFTIGNKWQSNIHIPAKSKEHYKIDFSDVHSEYTLEGVQTINLNNFGDIKCYEIVTKSIDPNGNIIVAGKYFFNEEYGFVKTDFKYKDLSVSLLLKKIE